MNAYLAENTMPYLCEIRTDPDIHVRFSHEDGIVYDDYEDDFFPEDFMCRPGPPPAAPTPPRAPRDPRLPGPEDETFPERHGHAREIWEVPEERAPRGEGRRCHRRRRRRREPAEAELEGEERDRPRPQHQDYDDRVDWGRTPMREDDYDDFYESGNEILLLCFDTADKSTNALMYRSSRWQTSSTSRAPRSSRAQPCSRTESSPLA